MRGRVRQTELVLLMAVAVVAALLIACEAKMKPSITAVTPGDAPTQESWNSRIVFTDSGRIRAVLHADHIRMYEDKRETLLDSNVVVDFYDADGQHTSRMRADRGKVDDASKNLEAFDRIVFVSDSGTTVKTDYLFWENARKKVRSDRFVTIKSPKEYLQGYGFEADQNLKNYVIFKVSGQAEVKEE